MNSILILYTFSNPRFFLISLDNRARLLKNNLLCYFDVLRRKSSKSSLQVQRIMKKPILMCNNFKIGLFNLVIDFNLIKDNTQPNFYEISSTKWNP